MERGYSMNHARVQRRGGLLHTFESVEPRLAEVKQPPFSTKIDSTQSAKTDSIWLLIVAWLTDVPATELPPTNRLARPST